MSLRRTHAMLWVALAALTLGLSPTDAKPTKKSSRTAELERMKQLRKAFPQAKINHIDTSAAPRIKVYVSALSRTMRAYDMEAHVKHLTLRRVQDKGHPKAMFTIDAAGELSYSDKTDKDKEAPSEEEAPTLTLAEDEERGMAAVVLMPDYASHQYRDGLIGQRQRDGAALLFTTLGQNNKMNLLRYNDHVWTYVYAEGRTKELTILARAQEDCDAWQEKLRRQGPPASEEGEEEGAPGPKDGEALCGLTDEYSAIPQLIATTPAAGNRAKLFDLGREICSPISKERLEDERSHPADEDELPAFVAGIRMLLQGAEEGQPRVMVLLGDGRDGPVLVPDNKQIRSWRTDCLETLSVECERDRSPGKSKKACRQERMQARINNEQLKFRDKVGPWLALAKAANIRIYTLIYPGTEAHERERLELLAFKTGGTARVAGSANEVEDNFEKLPEELNQQMVLTFTDPDAVPGASLAYDVQVALRAGVTLRTGPMTATVASVPEGFTVWVIGAQAFLEEKLGATALIAIAIGVGLLLLLLVVKLLKKLIGKGAKAPKGMKMPKGAKIPKAPKAPKLKAPKLKAPKLP